MILTSKGKVSQTDYPTILVKVDGEDYHITIEEGCVLQSTVKSDRLKTSVYKSLLQKSVRRMNLKEGLKALDWLWENDQLKLSRRIVIISVEDGFYHPEDNYFWVWMMLLNTKGYLLQNDNLKSIMRSKVSRLILHPGYSRKYEINSKNHFEFPEETLPLKIRFHFGGMKGDMEMLSKFIEQYCPKPHFRNLPLMESSKGKIVEACDFHVFPWLAKTVDEKRMFWEYRSGINYRDSETMKNGVLCERLIEYDKMCSNLYRKYIF
jgi:hypothetical protein